MVAAWQADDALRSSAFFTPDGVFAEAGHEPIIGRDAIVAHFTKFFRDGPIFTLVVNDLIVEGNRCAVFYAFNRKNGVALVEVSNDLVSLWREF